MVARPQLLRRSGVAAGDLALARVGAAESANGNGNDGGTNGNHGDASGRSRWVVDRDESRIAVGEA